MLQKGLDLRLYQLINTYTVHIYKTPRSQIPSRNTKRITWTRQTFPVPAKSLTKYSWITSLKAPTNITHFRAFSSVNDMHIIYLYCKHITQNFLFAFWPQKQMQVQSKNQIHHPSIHPSILQKKIPPTTSRCWKKRCVHHIFPHWLAWVSCSMRPSARKLCFPTSRCRWGANSRGVNGVNEQVVTI